MPSTTTTLLATDLQRSVLHLLNVQGRQPQAYTPYGHRPAESGLASLLGFNGAFRDSVTGHYLLGNGYRAFNPVLMRFNSPDSLSPFGKGGLNAYAYCVGDPVNRQDPTGHAPMRTNTAPTTRGGGGISSRYPPPRYSVVDPRPPVPESPIEKSLDFLREFFRNPESPAPSEVLAGFKTERPNLNAALKLLPVASPEYISARSAVESNQTHSIALRQLMATGEFNHLVPNSPPRTVLISYHATEDMQPRYAATIQPDSGSPPSYASAVASSSAAYIRRQQ